MAVSAEIRISPAGVYHIFTNSLGKRKVCVKWIAHVVNNEKEPCVFFFPPPLYRNEGNAFIVHILMLDESCSIQLTLS
jgi:hypothetical protein